ncbi:type II toxin-antitoxin system HicA family toxin [Xylanimonas oleitrophica]|uniref:Type II toxin-antitoxin system HicA family toxin n=1 Tax=Xylanimonas oleitrophica TaxID=2607479 RepID=A0A2W5WVB6_9MICO|nr:type II toxin-antitoxin system HicA family toxin [Xylanimonas oleitrophica]PZR55237.1 type II toxin-antitoxin system HicA family toxin [Xylanimonas oleitrophica]
MVKPMKRREVQDALAAHGCKVIREGGRHTVYGCPCGKHTAPLPRHGDVTAGVVRSIQKQMACLPEGWLQ